MNDSDNQTPVSEPVDTQGISWAGPGYRVEAVDDVFDNDMAAAAHIAAQTDARWLLYLERPADLRGKERPWIVIAYDDTSLATYNLQDVRDHGHVGFVIDGRRDLTRALQRTPEGGYQCLMPDGKARRIASEWAEGKTSVLTALATSGAVLEDAVTETRKIRAWATLNGYGRHARIELDALADYLEQVGQRGPVPGWPDLWDGMSVSDE